MPPDHRSASIPEFEVPDIAVPDLAIDRYALLFHEEVVRSIRASEFAIAGEFTVLGGYEHVVACNLIQRSPPCSTA